MTMLQKKIQQSSVLFIDQRERDFFIDMKKMDFEELRKSYLSLPIKQRIKNAIKKVLKPVLKRARRGGIKSNLDYGMLMQFNMGEKNE